VRETKVRHEACRPAEGAEHGAVVDGLGVGMEAFGSPIAAAAIVPAFRTRSGLTPKKAGFHRNRSASLPTSTEPTCSATPCAMAGLMVYFAT
jgi:hypothetical protein